MTADHQHRLEGQYFFDPAFRREQTPPAIGYRGKRRPYLRTEQADGPLDRKALPRTNCEVWKAYERLPDAAVREVVKRNVPKSRGQYRRRLVRMAVSLKAEFPRDGVGEWREVVGVWFFLARPCGPDWTREQVDQVFAESHARASGNKPGAKLAKFVAHAGKDVSLVLARLSRFLKRTVVFLSARKLAEWTGWSAATAARRLAALVAAGSIRVVREGVPHVYDRTATEYDVSPLVVLSSPADRDARTLASLHLLSPFGDPHDPEADQYDLDGDDELLCLTEDGVKEDTDEDDAFARVFADLEDDDWPKVDAGWQDAGGD